MNPVERFYVTKAHVEEILEVAGKVDAVLDELPCGADKDQRLKMVWHLQRAAEIGSGLPTPGRDLTAMLQASILIFDRDKRKNPAPGPGADTSAG
jgi:hypothetical protein